jgi:Ser/Thr protein kinase RdoA (MazF antagonist)
MDTEAIKRAMEDFGIGEGEPIMSIRESADNAVFVVGTKNKRVLRVSKRLPVEDIVFEYEAVNHLANCSVMVPRFLPAKSGEYCLLLDGAIAVLFEFIEGHHIEIDKDHLPTSQEAFEAGKGLAGMHNAGRKFKSTSIRHRTIFSELERVSPLEKVFGDEFEGGKDFIKQVERAIHFGKAHTEDMGLIHNDYRAGNVFFDDMDHLAGIIDFDWSCMAPITKDIALGVLEWSCPDASTEPDFKIFDAFLEGYNSVADKKQLKDQTLYDWAAFAALSDAATYFCDRVADPMAKRRINSSYMYRKYQFFAAKKL